jgi:hypothetical protein
MAGAEGKLQDILGRTMTRRQNRIFVSRKLPSKVPDLIARVRHIVSCSTNNAYFPDPTPPLAEITTAVDELYEAQVATLTRAKGTNSLRDEKLKVVRSLVGAYATYVQLQADANPDEAGSIIESSGFFIRAASTRKKLPFNVKQGRVSGTADVEILGVAKRASYEHRWSADGGKTWQPGGHTNKTKITITGLPVGVVVLFCFRPCTKTGEGDWSEPFAFLVK